ncbi:excalibur calcium-binding domain-containing protein [Nocardia sp. NBC_01327]|uniref:excalibur calcium-binding domain-containing protein n=1 Tax=Nocardia sp. NBC_01327 TaxID=2903593 RepID=UPI002E160223
MVHEPSNSSVFARGRSSSIDEGSLVSALRQGILVAAAIAAGVVQISACGSATEPSSATRTSIVAAVTTAVHAMSPLSATATPDSTTATTETLLTTFAPALRQPEITTVPEVPLPPAPPPAVVPTTDAPSAYYSSCAEARRAGVAPLRRGDPGYRPGLDRDGDGIACEK